MDEQPVDADVEDRDPYGPDWSGDPSLPYGGNIHLAMQYRNHRAVRDILEARDSNDGANELGESQRLPSDDDE